MNRLLRQLAVLLLTLLSFGSVSEAQFGYPCDTSVFSGVSRQIIHNSVIVRFNPNAGLVAIIDGQTREIYSTLLPSDVRSFEVAGWSPTCQYVAGNYWTDKRYFGVWNVETGEQLVIIDDRSGSRLSWSPDERYLIAHTFIEGRRTDMIINLATNTYGVTPWLAFSRAYDLSNDRVYVIHYRERDAAHAYQLSTGQHIATYAPTNQDERIFAQSLFLSDDRSHIVYTTNATYNSYVDGSLDTDFGGCGAGFAVWNVWTVTGTTIHTGCDDYPFAWGDGRRRLALSPDNRYFIMGRDIVRVWDLQALNPDTSPNWSYPASDVRIAHIRFVDNQIVETFAYEDYRYALRWNFYTGEYISAFDYVENVEVNRDGSPLAP